VDLFYIDFILLFFFIEPSTSKEKPTAISLLVKRKHQKEEHERARNKRHKERIEMDEKLLAILNKLAEK